MRNFDRVAKIYDATRGLPPPVMPAVVESLVAAFEGSSSVLDAGVGTGRFASPLAARGIEVTGVDVSQAMLAEASRKGARRIVRADLEGMPFPDRAFDSCLMVHVLHLVDNPGRLLSEVTRTCTSFVVSLVETTDCDSVRDAYIALRSELGRPWTGFSEQDLSEQIAPSYRREAASYSEEVKAEDDIDYFKAKLSAITWDVPDDVHGEIIRRLRARPPGPPECARTIEVVRWRAGDLRTFRVGGRKGSGGTADDRAFIRGPQSVGR